jgi:FtsP/CotA-like multicopper oxidase with cupredoxin domain
VPVERKKTFIAVAETYDFIVTIPPDAKLEVRATAQDGSGQTSAFLGKGTSVLAADEVPRPDFIGMMKQMAAMDMKMGAPALKFRPGREEPYKLMEKYGMPDMEEMDHSNMKGMRHDVDTTSSNGHSQMDHEEMSHDKMDHNKMDHDKMNHDKMDHDKINHQMNDSIKRNDDHKKTDHPMKEKEQDDSDLGGKEGGKLPKPDKDAENIGEHGINMFADFNYDFLRSPERTDFTQGKPVNEILLNLTGNMKRYIWSMNGVPLSEGDKIKINQGEVVRVTLNNLTMMHHPMHLHGHFFRVINEHGEYSPLKHTVNVAPMQMVVIEFDANEYGDWFFHCHILYHMDAGMARIFSYGTPRDERMRGYPLRILTNMSNHFFTWGIADVASHMSEVHITTANIRNQFNLKAEYGWNKNLEAELSYERYLYDYFRVFIGVNAENETENNLDEIETTAIAGIRYLTPYLFNLDVRIDNWLRPQIELNREILIFPRTALFGEFEYQANFGWIKEIPVLEESFLFINKYNHEITWNIGLEYFLSKTFTITASYDNRFGAGAGLAARF